MGGTISGPGAVGERCGVAYSDINYDAASGRGVYAEVSTKVPCAKLTSSVGGPGSDSVSTLSGGLGNGLATAAVAFSATVRGIEDVKLTKGCPRQRKGCR